MPNCPIALFSSLLDMIVPIYRKKYIRITLRLGCLNFRQKIYNILGLKAKSGVHCL